MKKVSELFSARARNPWEVANMRNGSAGFRIPEYQRAYDWSRENIHRLMTDIFTGFERLSEGTGANTFTFLGTLILVKDKKQEPEFQGRSYSIVDGQQRLTTLTLLACVLIERLRILRQDLPDLKSKTIEWLEIETNSIEFALASCIRGTQLVQHDNVSYPFPRIVRHQDYRGDSVGTEELKSEISIFQTKFVEFIRSKELEFLAPDLGNTREANKILTNFQDIQQFCKDLNDPKWFEKNDCQFLEANKFPHRGYRNLWKKAHDVLENDNELSKAISEILQSEEIHNFYRTLMLAAYFCNCVAVTTVITDDEDAAFDIFDALNTTGEPLTALETLKPHVINAAKSRDHGYSGSDCEIAFNSIDDIMANNFPETKQKQDEAKHLVITFALYLEGRKISLNLNAQRTQLLRLFNNSKTIENGPTKFMNALASVSEYRCNYWTPNNIGEINKYHNNQIDAELVKLLCSLISATKTNLTLPILARYWIVGKERTDFTDYIKVIKAITAFLTIRRAATGTTDGIDTCFRDIMEDKTSNNKFGLCTGLKFENQILSVSELKSALVSKLESRKVKYKDKDEWIKHVIDTPIYTHSQPIVRFMLLCASHNTAPDKDNPGLLTREGIPPSDNRSYLDYKFWNGEDYKTVEHVAPNSDKPEGWNNEIYSNSRIRNTLGNLVLLPVKENNAVGKASWKKKNLFYTALTDETMKKRKSALESAKRQGLRFHAKTEELILNGKRLSMLDGIRDVENWDKEFIEKRTHRLASLAWDTLRPWLD
ncbi:MAG: DUF262 domain-containing protein [Rhodobacteraceae bacterium]|nr:DUF262 domain-containing protein [Paracoccaceae bacterium]